MMYKISPSDLTFGWDGCHYCFYMKVKHGIVLRGIFPGMFGRMANMTSGYYLGKSTAEISPTLPPGRVTLSEKWVQSEPISPPGASSQCYIKGRFDAVMAFDNGTYGIIDYKTSEATDEQTSFYSRQLSAYAYALEHPAPRALSLSPIARMGLFVVTPDRFEATARNEKVFVNKTVWTDVPRDDEAFMSLLGEVVALLDAPGPPESDPDCETCNYRKTMEEWLGD
ncbi:MAG: PD-(D/E)XK nuclease family protein [Anaerolineales bacterium]